MLPYDLDSFAQLLEKVEKKVDDRLFIEREMSAAFLLEVLGKDWFRSHVALSSRVELKIQPVYNNWPRFDLPDRNVFSVKRDKWGLSRCSKSFFEALLSYRMTKQPTTERDSYT